MDNEEIKRLFDEKFKALESRIQKLESEIAVLKQKNPLSADDIIKIKESDFQRANRPLGG